MPKILAPEGLKIETESNGLGAPLLGGSEPPTTVSPLGSARSLRNGAATPLIGTFGLEEPHAYGSRAASLTDLDDEVPVVTTASGSMELSRVGSKEKTRLEWLQRLWSFNGPGWLMMVAYIDPGNLEADLQCGALFNYSLLWALLVSTLMGLGMQLVAMRLGTVTRRHLAVHCRDHYPKQVRIALWLATELAIVGSDIQEVIGCSIGLELMFGFPLWIGVLVSAGLAFTFLFMENLGARKLEAVFAVLITMLTSTMLYLFAEVSPDQQELAKGMLEPSMPSLDALQQVVGMVGCVIMPHNLFLHSALVNSRPVEPNAASEAVTFFTIESSFAIATSLLINTACVAVFAQGFYGSEVATKIGLRNAGDYLGTAFSPALRTIWALGLIASGQSSTMTGTYAGQWVMQGYLDLKVKPWKRAILTRGCALMPTLIVAVMCQKQWEIDVLNGYLNVLQAMVLPFAMVPLILFASSRGIMGEMALSRVAGASCWVAFSAIMLANCILITGQSAAAGWALLGGVVTYSFMVVYVIWAPSRSLQALDRSADPMAEASAAPNGS
mmetsp:Transcript_5872/g.14011  ORF Transcript_5872/g.14011 Transcript_5872/m.14011 type:complete len:555 (+) Transcript_5872:46-1710(+)